jgi:hypothetical protein
MAVNVFLFGPAPGGDCGGHGRGEQRKQGGAHAAAHPCLACEAAACARTVRTAFSMKTPCAAHCAAPPASVRTPLLSRRTAPGTLARLSCEKKLVERKSGWIAASQDKRGDCRTKALPLRRCHKFCVFNASGTSISSPSSQKSGCGPGAGKDAEEHRAGSRAHWHAHGTHRTKYVDGGAAHLFQAAVVGRRAAAVVGQLLIHVGQAGRHALPGRHGEAQAHRLAVVVVRVLRKECKIASFSRRVGRLRAAADALPMHMPVRAAARQALLDNEAKKSANATAGLQGEDVQQRACDSCERTDPGRQAAGHARLPNDHHTHAVKGAAVERPAAAMPQRV